MTKFELVKKWAKENGFDWRSTYGRFSKAIITHNSTPPINLEPEEMEHMYDIVEAEKLKLLESYAWLADQEYTWSEVDNWIFAFGSRARDDLILRRQQANAPTRSQTI